MKRAACGECGNEEHTIALSEPDEPPCIDLECCRCGSVTHIRPTAPAFDFRAADTSDGQIAVFRNASRTRVHR